MGREAMNAPPPKLERKSSKESLVRNSEVKKRTSPRNPLKELNSGSIPPLSSTEALKGGCFRFLLSDSSAKELLARSKPLARTPRSSPPNPRNVVSNSKNPTNPSRHRTSQKKGTKSNFEVPKQLGSRKASKPRPPDLCQQWNKRKPSSSGKNPDPKFEIEEGSERKIGSCLASTPQRTLIGFDTLVGFEAAKEGDQNLTSTPTSAITPPVQASISPEVPVEVSAVAATPVCFAAGHVIAGIYDRRKCRPRGILTIGGSELEVEKVHGGGSDPIRVSVMPPPLAEASISWLSSPSDNVNSGLDSSFGSSSKVLEANIPAEASMDWFLHPCEDGERVLKDEFLMETRTSPDHGFWRFSPDNSTRRRSTEVRGLLGLNSSGLETTPSCGIGIQKTPTTGGSVSPFSMMLERIARTSKSKFPRPQQDRRGHRCGSALGNLPSSVNSWIEDHATCTPSPYSSSTKKYSLSDFKMDAMAEALKNISLSPKPLSKDTSCQAPLPGLSFQFGCLATLPNSVDLNHFQNPSCDRISMLKNVCTKGQVLPRSHTRISWREGLVGRIFETGELDCCQWLSDDEDNFNHHEDDRVGPTADLKFDPKSSSAILNNQNEHIAPAGFGSAEFVFEAEKSEAKVPPQGPISCAESISTEGLVLDSSGDSDWTYFYENHLFEV